MKSVKKIEFRICIIRIWLVLFLLLGQKVWAVPLSDISLKLMCDSLAGLLDSISYCNNNGDLMRGSTFNKRHGTVMKVFLQNKSRIKQLEISIISYSVLRHGVKR